LVRLHSDFERREPSLHQYPQFIVSRALARVNRRTMGPQAASSSVSGEAPGESE
jgi:hypothetical protein